MTRKAKRETIRSTLAALTGPGFAAVYKGARRKFQGLSPVATILSQSKRDHFATRGASSTADWDTFGFVVNIFVRADDGVEETAEDLLDDLREAAGTALFAAGYDVGESDAEPLGFALRNIDGVVYRVEKIPITIEEY